MGRKFNLIKESNKMLQLVRRGSYQTKAFRKREIHQFINDLIRLGIAPTSLTKIETRHIEVLVNYWKQMKLNLRTIYNKLGIIRTFFQFAAPEVAIPSNKSLKLPFANKATSESMSLKQMEDTVNLVEHSFTQTILAFQLYFGLTKLESIRININYAENDNKLLIDRALASNGKDRYIPILHIHQKSVIAARRQLLCGNESLTSLLPESSIIALYKADMLLKGLDPQYNYRRYYANIRGNELSKAALPDQKYKQLQSELGISSKHRLMELL